MKKVIIFGNNNFAKQMKWYVENDTEDKVVCFTVDNEYINCKSYDGIPVISFGEIQKMFLPEDYQVLVAVGTMEMGQVREKISLGVKNKGYNLYSYIHSSAIIQQKSIGEGNIILENVVLQPFVSIGNNNLIWENVSISHNNSIGNFNTLAPMVSLSGNITIKNNCFIGNNAVLSNNITINDFSLIGAGSYVKNDTKPYQVIVPQKSFVLEDKISTDFKI